VGTEPISDQPEHFCPRDEPPGQIIAIDFPSIPGYYSALGPQYAAELLLLTFIVKLHWRTARDEVQFRKQNAPLGHHFS